MFVLVISMDKSVIKELIKEGQEINVTLFERPFEDISIKRIRTIIGVRRSGKSYLQYQIMSKIKDKSQILYINFEDDRLIKTAFLFDEILDCYFEMYPENTNKKTYIFFDEIQNLDNWAKKLIRLNNTLNADIYVTGSSSKLMSKEIYTGLRGKSFPIYWYPLSFSEFLNFKGIGKEDNAIFGKVKYKYKKLVDEYLNYGGFPEIVLEKSKKKKRELISDYIKVIIYKDIIERYNIRRADFINDLFRYLANTTSKYFSQNKYYNSVAKEKDVAREVVYNYVNYLIDSGLLYLVPNFSFSTKKSQVNPKKPYLIDLGIYTTFGYPYSKGIDRVMENAVFLKLIRTNENIFYYNNNNYEIDFITSNSNKINALYQVSYDISNKETREREISGLLNGMKEFKLNKSYLITYDSEETMSIEKKQIFVIPLWKWLLQK